MTDWEEGFLVGWILSPDGGMTIGHYVVYVAAVLLVLWALS